MSAVPKKKLCWNCEGNVSREIDNCPYCGVYLHASEMEEDTSWNPNYLPTSKTEEIPAPLYQHSPSSESLQDEDEEPASQKEKDGWGYLFTHLKKEIFPLLFLMMGSVFFLFGIVLFLFAHDGTLTLQWQGSDSLYFLFSAIPLIFFGWKYLQEMENYK